MADDPLLRRVRAEFLEMPGLRLTREQAQRLWAIDHVTCGRLLETLVELDFLICAPDGRYSRRTEGVVDSSSGSRMAKANLAHVRNRLAG